MLSVGIVTFGGVGYYVQTVGAGVDDYYARTEPGRWMGAGAAEIGLAGRVDSAQIDALAGGTNPVTGERLGMRVAKVAAFDLTFSAPKSVSLVAELTDRATRTAVADAHHAAVASTVQFVERSGVLAGRRGFGGVDQVTVAGAVAAEFTHRTSRAGDPQLHAHVLLFNRALASDGRWGGLDGRRIFAWAKTAGYVYQAALRAELSERVGARWEPVVNGVAELAGFRPDHLDAFSARRAQIEAHLSRAGLSGSKAAQIATLATRPAKPEPVDPDTQRRAWREQAAAVGLGLEELSAVIGHTEIPAGFDPSQLDRLAGHLAGPGGLTEHRSAFDRRAVIQAVAEAAAPGARPADIDAAVKHILGDGRFVRLGVDDRLAGPAYTTADLLNLEAHALACFERAILTPVRCDPAMVARSIAERPSLSTEQQHMIHRICTGSDPVQVVVGRAGTGKTYALDAARAAWAACGVQVVGAALAARTAAGLQAGTGIPSVTVDQLLTDAARPGGPPPLPPRGVLVIDEAGMVGTRKLAALLTAAQRAHCKVVLVGDPRQLPEVEAGGAFSTMAKRDPIELATNRRQVNEWERQALDQLRHGDVARAVAVYRDHQRINLTATAEEARRQMVAEWWGVRAAADNPADVVMLALHQADVDHLNRLAREHVQAGGRIGDTHLEVGGRVFAAGDEVLALRNDRRLAVTNGTRATVVDLEPDRRSLQVRTIDGRTLVLPAAYLDAGHLTHGYCLTVHKAQGLTASRAFVLGSERLYREAGYTGLSRATQRTDFYQVTPTPVAWQPTVDPYGELAKTLSRSAAHTLASELQPQSLVDIRDAALADPAAHLVDLLGPPPAAGRQRDAWASAATAIESYRHHYQVTGPDPLGPRPQDPDQLRRWEHAHAAARDIHRHLELDHTIGLGR